VRGRKAEICRKDFLNPPVHVSDDQIGGNGAIFMANRRKFLEGLKRSNLLPFRSGKYGGRRATNVYLGVAKLSEFQEFKVSFQWKMILEKNSLFETQNPKFFFREIIQRPSPKSQEGKNAGEGERVVNP
jgi:hypothetical protein